MSKDHQRLFGTVVLIASVGMVVVQLSGASPLPSATLADWCGIASSVLSAIIGSFIAGSAGA